MKSCSTVGYMLRIGCLVLSIWLVLNLIPSAWILASVICFDGDSPAVFQILDKDEVEALTAKERTSINSVAIFANGLNVAFCVTAWLGTWFGLARRARWTFWALAIGFTLALLAGVAGDYVLGTIHPEISIISALILLVGFAFSAAGLFQTKPEPS